jgi:hypothetical protein
MATGSCATSVVTEGHVIPWKCPWGVLYDVRVPDVTVNMTSQRCMRRSLPNGHYVCCATSNCVHSKGTPKGSNDLRSHPVAMLLLLRKRGEKPGMRRTYFGTDKLVFAVVLCGGATGSDMTGSDVSHVTGSDPIRKYVMRMRNRKSRHICPSRAFWPEVTKSRDWKRLCRGFLGS